MASQAFNVAVGDWDERGKALLVRLAQPAVMTVDFALEQLPESEVEEQVDEYLRSADRLVALTAHEDVDGDAVVTGVASHAALVVDGLVASGSEPQQAQRMLPTLDTETIQSQWGEQHDEVVAYVRELSAQGGSDDATFDIGSAVQELDHAAGTEVVALFRDTAVLVAPTMLISGLDGLLSGGVRDAFDAAVGALRGLMNWLKRIATRVVGNLVNWLFARLPDLFRGLLPKIADQLTSSIMDRAGDLVGGLAGRLFGQEAVLSDWNNATPTPAQNAQATRELQHRDRNIEWVTKGRTWIERSWVATIVAAVSTAQPALKVAYAVAVAAIFGWVLLQQFAGLHKFDAIILALAPQP